MLQLLIGFGIGVTKDAETGRYSVDKSQIRSNYFDKNGYLDKIPYTILLELSDENNTFVFLNLSNKDCSKIINSFDKLFIIQDNKNKIYPIIKTLSDINSIDFRIETNKSIFNKLYFKKINPNEVIC